MIGFEFEKAVKLLCIYFPESESLKKPTLFHSLRVGAFLWNLWYSEALQIAWLLHDSLEDTAISEDLIESEFGIHVLSIVKANTKNLALDTSERNANIVQRCSKYWKDAIIIKIADIYDNFLFYISQGNVPEIERCKILADLVSKYSDSNWNDPIFAKVTEIQLYNNN